MLYMCSDFYVQDWYFLNATFVKSLFCFLFKTLLTTFITISAIVASRRVLVVAVDVGDRRADGNGYEDEEPREAAYRPRFRHPRNDGG